MSSLPRSNLKLVLTKRDVQVDTHTQVDSVCLLLHTLVKGEWIYKSGVYPHYKPDVLYLSVFVCVLMPV